MSSPGTTCVGRVKTLLCIVLSDLLKRNANQIGSPCILKRGCWVSMTARRRVVGSGAGRGLLQRARLGGREGRQLCGAAPAPPRWALLPPVASHARPPARPPARPAPCPALSPTLPPFASVVRREQMKRGHLDERPPQPGACSQVFFF